MCYLLRAFTYSNVLHYKIIKTSLNKLFWSILVKRLSHSQESGLIHKLLKDKLDQYFPNTGKQIMHKIIYCIQAKTGQTMHVDKSLYL